MSRHHQGSHHSGVGTEGRARRGPRADHRLVPCHREREHRVSQTRVDSRAMTPALAWLTNLSPSMWLAAIVLVAFASLFPGLWTLVGLGGLVVCVLILVRPELAVYLLALSVPLGSLYETKVVGNLSLIHISEHTR